MRSHKGDCYRRYEAFVRKSQDGNDGSLAWAGPHQELDRKVSSQGASISGRHEAPDPEDSRPRKAHAATPGRGHSSRNPCDGDREPNEGEQVDRRNAERSSGSKATTHLPDQRDKRRRMHASSPDAQDPPRQTLRAAGGKRSAMEVDTKKLSFGDELEDGADSPGALLSLGESTQRRFQEERVRGASPPPPVLLNGARWAYEPAAEPAAASGPASLGQLRFGVSQARGARPYMEDRHTVIASYKTVGSGGTSLEDGVLRSFAAVYDGHNGSKAAEEASARLHVVLAGEVALRTCTGSGPPSMLAAEEAAMSAALARSYHALDREILARARAEEGRDGATGLVLLRTGDALWTAHAGDSRAVLSRGRRAVRLTEDHKPHLAAERARIEANGGRVEFQRCWRVICTPRDGRPGSGLAVSRSFGDLDFKEVGLVTCDPDVRRYTLAAEDDFIVAASDGLWDVMNDQDAVDIAQKILAAAAPGGKYAASDALAKELSDALVLEALQRGTMDNVTALVVLLQWD